MKNNMKVILMYVVFILAITWLVSSFFPTKETETLSYSDVLSYFDKGEVRSFSVDTNNRLTMKLRQADGTKDKTVTYDLRDLSLFVHDTEETVKAQYADGTIEKYDYKPVVVNWWVSFLPYLIMMVVFIAFWIYMVRQMNGQGGKMNSFGRARVKVASDQKKRVTFADVAGADEEKEELEEVVEFLKHPAEFEKLGAKIPHGVLLMGPPGTGKTLLAKAVAGEANVPFFSLSGSEFVEMFVGVGASRVRDLFRKANNMAPCIIFIDEIDAIGGKRDTRHGGGDSEREQTLNQLLSEMDGFDSSKGIIVLAATNRPEVLDKALLRPGRFDRRIIVSKPDMQGRIDTLKVHSKNVKMDETVDFKELALATSGAVGADLANIINEAALMAVRNKRDYVSQKDLIASVEVVFAGKEKKEKLLSPREKKIVAYHEVGHALVAALQKNTLPIQRITIVPRTSGALGYVWQVPEEEKQLQTKKEMEEDIVTFLAGRAAEELKFDSVTNGASNDIEKATSLARTMITMYGMSEKFGMVQLEGVTGEYLDNRRVLNCSSETETKVDTEVKNMMKASYEKAYKLLKKNMPTLDAIAQVLYEKENLSGKEFMELYERYQNVKLTEAEKVQ